MLILSALYLVSLPWESWRKADGFGVGWVLRLDRLGSPVLTSSPPDSLPFREEGLYLVKADSLGPRRAALPGTQPRRAGGTAKPHQSHRAGRAPESARSSNLSPKWPTGWALSPRVRPCDSLASGACPEKGSGTRAGGGIKG